MELLCRTLDFMFSTLVFVLFMLVLTLMTGAAIMVAAAQASWAKVRRKKRDEGHQ